MHKLALKFTKKGFTWKWWPAKDEAPKNVDKDYACM